MAYTPPSDPVKAAKKKAAIEARLQKKNEKMKAKEEKKAKKMAGKKDGDKKTMLKKPSMPSLKKKVSPDGAKKEPKKDAPTDGEPKGLKKIDLFGKEAKAKNAVLEEEKAQLEQKTSALERQLGNMSMKNQRAKQMIQQAMMSL
jgi:hypothetical protein